MAESFYNDSDISSVIAIFRLQISAYNIWTIFVYWILLWIIQFIIF